MRGLSALWFTLSIWHWGMWSTPTAPTWGDCLGGDGLPRLHFIPKTILQKLTGARCSPSLAGWQWSRLLVPEIDPVTDSVSQGIKQVTQPECRNRQTKIQILYTRTAHTKLTAGWRKVNTHMARSSGKLPAHRSMRGKKGDDDETKDDILLIKYVSLNFFN